MFVPHIPRLAHAVREILQGTIFTGMHTLMYVFLCASHGCKLRCVATLFHVFDAGKLDLYFAVPQSELAAVEAEAADLGGASSEAMADYRRLRQVCSAFRYSSLMCWLCALLLRLSSSALRRRS